MDLNPVLYDLFIDPLLKKIRGKINIHIPADSSVIDVACGTGAQSFNLAEKCKNVTGIDILEPMIEFAEKKRQKLNIRNIKFGIADATDLSQFTDKEFDYSIMSLAVHQFPPHLRINILNQVIRISKKLILTDYAIPQPQNFYGWSVSIIERIAGKEHFKCFRNYKLTGGMEIITRHAGLHPYRRQIFGKGVFEMGIFQEVDL